MTEAAIDIAEELVKHERGSPPKSNPKSMRALEGLSILSVSTATEMAQGARFRNVLAPPTERSSSMMSSTTPYRTLSGIGSSLCDGQAQNLAVYGGDTRRKLFFTPGDESRAGIFHANR